jgi:hypothetical protein
MLVSKWDSFSLKIPSGKAALLLTRWLLTKFYRLGKKYSDEDKAICYLIAEYWNSYRNERFYLNNELELLKLSVLMRFSLRPGKLEPHEKNQEILILRQRTLFTPRAFLSLPKVFTERFLSRKNRRLNKTHPELRRIGVGYRDKGTARESSKDGSPRWEDVAVSPQTRFFNDLESKRWWEVSEFLSS